MKPTMILEKLSKEAGLGPPLYQSGFVVVEGQRFYEEELVESEQGLTVTLLCSLPTPADIDISNTEKMGTLWGQDKRRVGKDWKCTWCTRK